MSWSHWVCLVTPRFATGLNSSLLPGRVPCFAELSTEFRKPEPELSRSYQPSAGPAPAPHVFRMSREGIRLLRGTRAAEYWTNYLFLAPTHLIITRTYQIEFPHLLLIYLLTLSGYSQNIECKNHHWFDFILLHAPLVSHALNPSNTKPNLACKQQLESSITQEKYFCLFKNW